MQKTCQESTLIFFKEGTIKTNFDRFCEIPNHIFAEISAVYLTRNLKKRQDPQNQGQGDLVLYKALERLLGWI